MKAFRPLWVAFRASILATAVFWVATFIVKQSKWQAPLDMGQEIVFFCIFFLGVMMVGKR